MSLGTKNSFSNAPSDFHISVLNFGSMFLVSNSFQNTLDGFASFHGKKDIHKKTCSGVHYLLRDFSFLASLGTQSSLENSEISSIIFFEFIQTLFSYLPFAQILT